MDLVLNQQLLVIEIQRVKLAPHPRPLLFNIFMNDLVYTTKMLNYAIPRFIYHTANILESARLVPEI